MTEDMLKSLQGRNALIESLAKQELVRGDQALARRLADCAKLRAYSVGDDIITEGNPPQEHLYLILSGKVQVLIGGKAVAEGGDGDAFGEFPILDPPTPHDVTLRASAPCVVAEVHERDVRAVGSEHCVFWENMARVIAHRLKASNAKLHQAA